MSAEFDQPHFNRDAELTVVNAGLACGKNIDQLITEVKPGDFFVKELQEKWEKICNAYNSGTLLDIVTSIVADLPERHVNLWDAVRTVQNHSARRKASAALWRLETALKDYSKPITEVSDKLAEIAMLSIDSRVSNLPQTTKDGLEDFKLKSKLRDPAFISGMPYLDEHARILPGDYAIIAARPKVGKSAIIAGMIDANMRVGNHGVYFSCEMQSNQVYARLISRRTGIPLKKLVHGIVPLTDEEKTLIKNEEANIAKTFPERWLIDEPTSIEAIWRVVLLMRPKWIVVDYAQITRVLDKSIRGEYEELKYVSMELRRIGLTTGTAVIVAAQLNRENAGKIPNMRNLRGSGQFEQDATHIMLIDRPESDRFVQHEKRTYYDHRGQPVEIVDMDRRTVYNRAALLVPANRNGPQLVQILDFHPDTASFYEYSAQYAPTDF